MFSISHVGLLVVVEAMWPPQGFTESTFCSMLMHVDAMFMLGKGQVATRIQLCSANHVAFV